MRSSIAQYMNEIVSLTIMALMCIALVAGQAGAEPRPAADEPRVPGAAQAIDIQPRSTDFDDPVMVIDLPELRVDISFRFRHTGE